VFRQVPEIKNIRLERDALAEILGVRLQNSVATAVAAHNKHSQQSHAAHPHI
jgi:hypothetical protein